VSQEVTAIEKVRILIGASQDRYYGMTDGEPEVLTVVRKLLRWPPVPDDVFGREENKKR
jgi:hypothetical protein